MLPWAKWPVGFQGMPGGVGDWDKEMNWGGRENGEEDLCDLMGLGIEKDGRLLQMVLLQG